MNDSGWIDRFIRHLEYERRLSPLTCKHYRRDLQALLAFCEKSGIDGWGDLDDGHIRAFSAASFRRGLSARSIQRQLSAARTFFRYLMREKHVSKNPITSVSAPKGKKRLPGNLDADRMARLLDIQGDGAIVDRDRAILELLYSSGLRLSELTDLDCGDVDLQDKTVRVTGKGNKDRIVPVGSHALKALARW
ncbi:MAG: site-specific integrase, partial [Woeseiaceae bacterium]